MRTVNIHEAKTQLSRLVDQASKGEEFIIAKAGKPLVKVVPLDAQEAGLPRRLGFLSGEIQVPDDFDRMGEDEIECLFGAGRRTSSWTPIFCFGRRVTLRNFRNGRAACSSHRPTSRGSPSSRPARVSPNTRATCSRSIRLVPLALILLPLDGAWRFGRNVVDDPVDAAHFVDDAGCGPS